MNMWRLRFRFLATIMFLCAFSFMLAVPIFATEAERDRYLALKDTREALLTEEFQLKKDKDWLLKDIDELQAKLRLKLSKLDSVDRKLKDIYYSIKTVEKDML